jgi:hypothetical protein
MALSGTFYTNVNSHWRLQGEWSASQSISGNYSNVTLKVYWMGLDSYGDTYTTATKYGSSTINGSSDSYSFSAKLTNAEKKLIQTHTVKVDHNSDGTKSISLSAYADINLTLSGTYYGRVSISDSITLNTIPRASSITSSANFTAGNNLYISVSRANSGFTHIARVYVNGVNVYSTSSSSKFGTSVTASINHTQVFNQLNGGATQDVRVEVDTYSGSTLIGKTGDSGMPPDKTGTVTAPNASTCDLTNTIANGTTVYFDQTITLSISRANSGFTHTVRFKDGNSGAVIKEFTGVGTSLSWTPNATEQAHIYNKIPTANELDGQVDIITYYSGEIVRSATAHDIEYRLRNQNPTFDTGDISYTDANSVTNTITGDASYIVQNKSTLRVNLVSLATPKYGATISRYDISVAGKTDSLTAVGYKDMGTISSSSNVALKVEAVDSRGNRTPATITVKILPWSPPVANVTAKRLNNFEDSTTITLSGNISPVTIGTAQKNKLKSATYEYKLTTSSTYSTPASWGTMPTTASYSFADKTLTLNNIYSYHVKIVVEDQFGSTTITKTVSTGQPIMFMDSSKKSVGINRFPSNSNVLEVQETMHLFPSTTATTKQGTIFSSNTYKTYIHFNMGSGSNDPAFIMHETGSDVTNNNRGVLHLCPSDDSDGTNDYVVIRGTNDPEGIRLYTDGSAWFNSEITATRIRLTSTADASGSSTTHALTVGNDTSGENMKMDANELSSFNGTSVSTLHLNPDGGAVTFNNSLGSGSKASFENGNLYADGFVQGELRHSHGYLLVGSYSTASYGSGSGKVWYNATDESYNFWGHSSSGGGKLKIGSLECGDIYLGSRSIIMTPPGNFDQIWFNDSNNAYYFQADSPSSKYGSGGGLGMIYASSVSSSSKREYKTNIRRFKDEAVETALSKVKNTEVYKYRYKHDVETEQRGRSVPDFRFGVMVEEAPEEIINANKDGIDLYAMSTMLWRAVQELEEQVDFLNSKLKRK